MTNAENIGAPAAKAVKKKASGSSFYIAMSSTLRQKA